MTNGFLDARTPTPHVVPLKPINWPQDKLRVPNGYGGLSPIERGNIYAGQEFFAITVPILNIDGPMTRSAIVPMEAYGDFWVSNIVGISTQNFGSFLPCTIRAAFIATQTFAANVKIEDITTGYNLFNEGVRFPYFVHEITRVPVKGRATRSTMPQPYCFLRDGAVKVTLENPAAIGASTGRNYYIILEGWREYQNASK